MKLRIKFKYLFGENSRDYSICLSKWMAVNRNSHSRVGMPWFWELLFRPGENMEILCIHKGCEKLKIGLKIPYYYLNLVPPRHPDKSKK